MRQSFYILKNDSLSSGMYFDGGDYKTLMPGLEVVLDHAPVNKTANIVVSVFRKEVENEIKQPLAKKVRKN